MRRTRRWLSLVGALILLVSQAAASSAAAEEALTFEMSSDSGPAGLHVTVTGEPCPSPPPGADARLLIYAPDLSGAVNPTAKPVASDGAWSPSSFQVQVKNPTYGIGNAPNGLVRIAADCIAATGDRPTNWLDWPVYASYESRTFTVTGAMSLAVTPTTVGTGKLLTVYLP